MAPSLRLLSHPSSPRGRSRHPRPRRVRAQEPGGVPAQAVLPCARRHHGDPVGTRRRRGHPSGAHRLLPGHEPAGEALRLGVQPQLRVRGAHRGERLQQLRVAALAPPGPPHVPLARQPGQAPARARDAAPAPLHPLPPPARRLSPAPGQPALGPRGQRSRRTRWTQPAATRGPGIAGTQLSRIPRSRAGTEQPGQRARPYASCHRLAFACSSPTARVSCCQQHHCKGRDGAKPRGGKGQRRRGRDVLEGCVCLVSKHLRKLKPRSRCRRGSESGSCACLGWPGWPPALSQRLQRRATRLGLLLQPPASAPAPAPATPAQTYPREAPGWPFPRHKAGSRAKAGEAPASLDVAGWKHTRDRAVRRQRCSCPGVEASRAGALPAASAVGPRASRPRGTPLLLRWVMPDPSHLAQDTKRSRGSRT
ncbi:fibroblast growth factor 22 isoform X2 [Dromaius novaehollandiae]|uniref:fibroblast growth factor 22 isoform X2 n=1 Tax=Dromaius novaehollandiae TaxID=8790 RepID=UPI00311E9906